VAGIRAVRPTVDTVVVDLHWGVEGATCPSPRQQELARALVAAGADVIVGSHSHRVMTAGRLDGAFVDYGLGNFAFYNESGLSGVTGVLRVTVTGRDVDARVEPGADLGRHPAPAERQCRGGRRRGIRVTARVCGTSGVNGERTRRRLERSADLVRDPEAGGPVAPPL